MHIGPHIGPGRRIGGIFVPPAGSGFYADYTRGRYATGGVPEAFAAKHTFTRTGVADWMNAVGDGLNPQVASNVPRIDGRGYLAEAQATNLVRNPTCVGAVVNGAAPTNMSLSANNGINVRIAGVGANYFDVEFSGTSSATALPVVFFETVTGIAALPAEILNTSALLSIVGGSLADVTSINWNVYEYDAGQAFLRNTAPVISGVSATPSRPSVNATMGASTAFARPGVYLTVIGAGKVVNLTLRISIPQTEKSTAASSPILTGPLTRNADLLNAAISGISAGGDWTIAGSAQMPLTAENNSEGIAALVVSGNDRWILRRNTSAALCFATVSGGSQVGAHFPPAPALGATFGWAMRRSGANTSFCLNGGGIVTTVPASQPAAAPTSVAIGHAGAGASQMNGRTRQIVTFPTAKSDAELQALATIGGIS